MSPRAATPAFPLWELGYTDWARWQERRLAAAPENGGRPERLWTWWRDRLAGAPPLGLPADRPRPAVLGERGGTVSFRLPAPLLDGVRALARSREATPFMALLAGFQLLLGRRGGQTDFLVGAPTSGRTSERLNGLVGYFVNPVALRADLSGESHGRRAWRARGARRSTPSRTRTSP